MSENEFHTGKLIPIDIHPDAIEGFLLKQFIAHNIEFDDYYNTYTEQAERAGYFVYKNKLWKWEDKKLNADGDTISNKNKDGSISYTILFYNGGAYITEVLESILKHTK